MTRKKCTGSELSVFKGIEAKLNFAVFAVLVSLGPLTINELLKQVSKQKGLGGTYYASLNKRLHWLATNGYVKELQPSCSRAKTYQLTNKAILTMVLDQSGGFQEIVDKTSDNKAGFLSAMLLSILFGKD